MPDASLSFGFTEIDRISVDLRTGGVFEMGWQSWSPTAVYPVTATSVRPVGEFYQIFYRPETRAPASGFEGEGLFAVQPQADAPVTVFGLWDGRVDVPSIRGVLDHDELVITANGPVERVVDDGPGGIYGALSRFADRYVGRTETRDLAPVPPLWASWYQYFTEFTQEHLRENLDAMDRLELPVGVVRLDDAFQAGIGDWLVPSDGFASLDGMVKTVLDRGRQAGIWIAPFLVGERSRAFADHPEWLVRDHSGDLVRAIFNWKQDCYILDVTHPGARAYLGEVFRTYRAWGVTYFMIDFVYAGAMPGVRHTGADPITAYRGGLDLIRGAIGDQAWLQGCGAPMFPSIGYVDTMRVGADIAPHYAANHDELGAPGGEAALVSTVGRAFTQGRFWMNDPDCLVARPEIERREQWADAVDRYGAVRISSDGLNHLDDWGLETTRRLLVPSRTTPFDQDRVPLSVPAVDAALAGRDRTERHAMAEVRAEHARERATWE